MLEQEIASIIKYILEASGKEISPYYYSVPEKFVVPSCYFPVPEVNSYGDTFNTYVLEYMWKVIFFHNKTQEAYLYAIKTLEAIRKKRNLIPLIDVNGEYTGSGIRIDDPIIKPVDEGAVQLFLQWKSHRPYDIKKVQKMMRNYLFLKYKDR